MSSRPSSESLYNFRFQQPPQVEPIQHALLRQREVKLSLLRLDKLDPYLGGNKWYKLQAYLNDARQLGCSRLVSFGGAWSNHLYALAAAGQRFGFNTVGVIRGERPKQPSELLIDLKRMQMQLVFVSRSDYRRRYEVAYLDQLSKQFAPCYVIPEGGAGELGAQGAANMLPVALRSAFDVVAIACGTGTSAAGLLNVLPTSTRLLGVSALKDGGSLQTAITGMAPNAHADWRIESNFAGAGFARVNAELVQFMDAFTVDTGIPLEPVYTGKLMLGLFALVEHGEFAAGTRILALHTGGLQGLRGMQTALQKCRVAVS